MPRVLTTNARILCPHGGVGISSPLDPKWVVEGGKVLLDGDPGILSCMFIPPCASYQLQSMKLNSTTVDGRNVMLVTDFTRSVTGFPLTIQETHHVFDDSSLTPIPAGAPPPSIPPELQEIDQPNVVAAPDALAFNLTTKLPLVASMTFTLQSEFPRAWTLSMLSEPTQQHRDITMGELPNLIVAPPGGAWTSPLLIVTVTLKAAFMATLLPKFHYFVLTAVNFRGKSHHDQVKLTITP